MKIKNDFFTSMMVLGICFLAVIAKVCQAASQSKEFSTSHHIYNYSPVITLSGGLALANVGHSQTLTMPNDYTTYQYSASHSTSESLIGAIFAGEEIALNSKYLAQAGIEFYGTGGLTSGQGTLTQGIDPSSSEQFPYRYSVRNQSLLVEGKLLGTWRNQMHPWLSLGLGAAFNQAYNYIAAVPPFLTFTPEFIDHTTTNFAWVVGIGMDVDITKNARIGAGYRLANIGQTKLGQGYLDDKLFSGVLTQSNLYMQAVMAHFTWRFGQ